MVKHTLLWDKYVVNKNHWVDKKPLPVQSKAHHSAFIFLFVLSQSSSSPVPSIPKGQTWFTNLLHSAL